MFSLLERHSALNVSLCGGLALVLVTMMSGCSGCRPDPLVERKDKIDIDEELEKKKLKRKDDFEIKAALPVPGEGSPGRPMAKPGHWTSVVNEIRANNFDFPADLHTAVTDTQGNIHPVENTNFQLVTSRPAPLPKGQLRVFESTYFIPPIAAQNGKTVWMNRELRAARGGRLIGQPDRLPVAAIEQQTYYMVVLSSDADRYGYLKRLSAIDAPSSGDTNRASLLHYRVVLPQIERIVPLPSHSLTWSTIAYLLWDDLDSGMFTPGQEQALLDWLHWGGQIIVSGPNSLEKIQGDFLEPYLPADPGETVEISAEAIAEINNYWAIADPKTEQRRTLKPVDGVPLVGVDLQPRPGATPLPHTGGLVVERRVGRGRIVATSFALNDRALINWPCFDSFFNACLLRRPGRRFDKREFTADMTWVGLHRSLASDSRIITGLRYFTRDIGHFRFGGSANSGKAEPEDQLILERAREAGMRSPLESPESQPLPPEARNPQSDHWHFDGYQPRRLFGMAAWNDRSGASDAAREALRDAAGISVPRGEFVLQILAVYLLVLAPANWLLFRLIGRVEWAWVAAPVIAIVGAFAVIRMAQLDIGFARSVTEVAVAEMQGSYPRAHLTRYSALYTSLSTSYEMTFDGSTAVAQPFSALNEDRRGSRGPSYEVYLRREDALELEGFRVPSNKTGILHAEQFVDLGSFLFNEGVASQLENSTAVTLQDAGVFRCTPDGRVEAAWVGTLSSNSTVPLEFHPMPRSAAHFSQWDNSSTTMSYQVQLDNLLDRLDGDDNGRLEYEEIAVDPALAADFTRLDRDHNGEWNREEIRRWCRRSRLGELSLGQMFELASQGLQIPPGTVRLIGWTDEQLPGVEIRPTAAQTKLRTMFLVHLRSGDLPTPQPDENIKFDVVDEAETLDETDLQAPPAFPGEDQLNRGL